MTIAAGGPNAEQFKYWNEISGPKWVALDEQLDPQIAPLGRLAMDRAAIRAGERVLDVGCGCGNTSAELARRVGPSGAVTGIDISAPMLARARQRATELGLAQLHFEHADAQTHPFRPEFDLLFSRFGIMFFAQPALAFANLRRALRPGGRVAFVCWQSIQLNPWMAVPVMAAMQHVPIPLPQDPHAPGPFAFADPQRVRGILGEAGFAGIDVEDVQTTVSVGASRDLDEVVDFLLQMGPVGQAMREQHADALPRVAAAVREALLPYHGDQGVRMGAAVWIVRAHL